MSEPSAVPAAPPHPHHQSFWLWVMCLTGVDYFSTLGYQPSIAYGNAGLLAPLAPIVLARLVSGWAGKVLVLVLLGFAATDFVITKTLSAADAATHAIQNPHWPAPP